MAKGQNTQAKVSGETSDKLYYGENNQCLNFLNAGLGLIALALVIPWSIWAFTSSLWPTSEAFNADTMTWVKVAILALFIVPFVQIFFGCALALCCKSASKDMKQCMTLSAAVFSVLSALFKCIWGVLGAILMSKVETNSTWFALSIMIMDLILLMYIVPFVWTVLICFQQCCCKNKQQKIHAQNYANLDHE